MAEARMPGPPGISGHGADAQKFNSWVIGGGYSKAQIKRNQIRTDLALQKRQASEDDAESLRTKIASRRAELKDREQPIQQYKPKYAAAMREERRREAEAAFATRRAGTPPQGHEKERLGKAVEALRTEHPLPEPDTAAELRERLKDSFEGQARDQPAGLFPPLLQPFSRPMTFLRGRERSKPRTPGGIALPESTPQNPQGDRVVEPFGLSSGPQRRAHPATGPHAFLPTGSSSTAYRHFTNYGLLARLSAANADGLGLNASALTQ